MFDAGIRLSELVGIDLGDVQFEERGIYVRGKGDKERWVPYGKSVHQALWKYVKARQVTGRPVERHRHTRRRGLRPRKDKGPRLPEGRAGLMKHYEYLAS